MNANLKNGQNWRTAGIILTLARALVGWAYTLGISRGMTNENTRNIGMLTTNVQTIAVTQTTLAVEMARTAEAVRALSATMIRIEGEVKALEDRSER